MPCEKDSHTFYGDSPTCMCGQLLNTLFPQTKTTLQTQLKWETISAHPQLVQRTPIHGGWLVMATQHPASICFVPDSAHKWDGTTKDLTIKPPKVGRSHPFTELK